MQHPAFQSKSQLVAMKRDDLLTHYALWLDAVNGTKLAVTFGADRKNTKAVIADRIIALQVKSDPLAQDSVNVRQEVKDEVAKHPVPGMVADTPESGQRNPVVRKSTAVDSEGTGKLIPKFAPRSKGAGLRDAMIRLYKERPDFLPSHLRSAFGCIG